MSESHEECLSPEGSGWTWKVELSSTEEVGLRKECHVGEVSLEAPLERIPVMQKAGSVVARQMRLRRSAAMMTHDPFSYFIVRDDAGKAEGWIYHDERDG